MNDDPNYAEVGDDEDADKPKPYQNPLDSPDNWDDSGQLFGDDTRPEPLAARDIIKAYREVCIAESLNTKQAIVLKLLGNVVMQRQAVINKTHGIGSLNALLLYLGGEGGTGKSRLISAFCRLLSDIGLRSTLKVCATTGAAADNINGSTLHSACRLKIRGSNPEITAKDHAEWKSKDYLIVDEVSMLPVASLGQLEHSLRIFKRNDAPFGGLAAVILSGDFYQFPPINAEALWMEPPPPNTTLFASSAQPPTSGVDHASTQSSSIDDNDANDSDIRNAQRSTKVGQSRKVSWQTLRGRILWQRFKNVIILDEQMRQADDVEFRKMLTRARGGEMTVADHNAISDRLTSLDDIDLIGDDRAKVITKRNAFRHMVNLFSCAEYSRVHNQPLFLFRAEHDDPKGVVLAKLYAVGDSGSDLAGPGILPYTDGMPCVVNRNTATNLGLVNGTVGRAHSVLLNPQSRVRNVSGNVWLVDKPPQVVLVKMDGETRHNPVDFMPEPDVLLVFSENVGRVSVGSVRVPRTQVPMSPAFAITDYKCQGRTFDRVAIDFEGTIHGNGKIGDSQGQYADVYVPLSRVRKLSGISLLRPVRRELFLTKPDARLNAEMVRLRSLEVETLHRASGIQW